MKDNIYSVTQVNNYIKLLLEDDVLLNGIYIEGEISNFKRHTSGHIYFTIKDEECSINAVMYKQDALNINNTFSNGTKVICFGYISSYSKSGQYQICVKNIKNSGLGNIFLDFEFLKEKLKNEGLFDEVYKMDIPEMPRNIGVITSQTGAAIRDILNVAKRRNPNVKIILIPALVQGQEAPKSIINAINMANDYKNLDVIILARGGGSKEDLWAFNDESLARAIFYSSIPIVTGIGHQIDFTIADFVADFRAPTPSAAIEICLPKAEDLQQKLYNLFNSINKSINNKLDENKLKFQLNINNHCFTNFLDKILDYQNIVENKLQKVNYNINNKLKENKFILNSNISKIEALSPINILKNGYTLVSDEKENNIKSVKDLKKDDKVILNFYDGAKKAKIIE